MLVVSTPAVRCDERQHEGPALADQLLVSVPTAFADLVRNPGKVELDRSAGAVLEVDEARSALRGEHVPRVRLTMQQLLGDTAVAAQPGRQLEPLEEELAVFVREVWRRVAVDEPPLDPRETIRAGRRAH